MASPSRQWLTPPQLAAELAVKPSSVLAWIRGGELRAIDVSRPGSRRPRFRIHCSDIIAFTGRSSPR